MSATIYALTAEVREAALDVKAVQKQIQDAGFRAYEWYPAHASARARMVALSRERTGDQLLHWERSRARNDNEASMATTGPEDLDD